MYSQRPPMLGPDSVANGQEDAVPQAGGVNAVLRRRLPADQAATLEELCARRGHVGRLTLCGHSGELPGVVAFGLDLDQIPGPRLVQRVGDDEGQAQGVVGIGDPSGDGADLQDDQAGMFGYPDSRRSAGSVWVVVKRTSAGAGSQVQATPLELARAEAENVRHPRDSVGSGCQGDVTPQRYPAGGAIRLTRFLQAR